MTGFLDIVNCTLYVNVKFMSRMQYVPLLNIDDTLSSATLDIFPKTLGFKSMEYSNKQIAYYH